MKDIIFSATETNTYLLNPKATPIGQPLHVSKNGREFTNILYSCKLSLLTRLAHLVRAFVATLFTLFLGLMSASLRQSWSLGFTGKELVHVSKEKGIDEVSDAFLETHEFKFQSGDLAQLKKQVNSSLPVCSTGRDRLIHYLSLCVRSGQIVLTKRIIDEFITPFKVEIRPTLLHLACGLRVDNPHQDEIAYRLAKKLIQLGTDINFRNDVGTEYFKTALGLAIYYDNFKTAGYLLRLGANRPTQELFNESPQLVEKYEKARQRMMTENERLFILSFDQSLPFDVFKTIILFSLTLDN